VINNVGGPHNCYNVALNEDHEHLDATSIAHIVKGSAERQMKINENF